MHKYVYLPLVLVALALPCLSNAADIVNTADNSITTTIARARVVDVVNNQIPNSDQVLGVMQISQTVKAKVQTGAESGKTIVFENDYITLKPNEVVYIEHLVSADGATDLYSVRDPYRMPVLYVLLAIFIGCVILLGGIQGVRGLASLAGGLVLILYVLMPAIAHGFSPLFVSLGVSSLIIVVGSYITHGFNKTTTAAVLGMIATVIVTGAGAYIAVHAAHLTGYSSEEATFLDITTKGTIDFVGLLMGGIMIGLLGVLYDVAISQAIAVEELWHVAPHLPRTTIYARAIRIGREHIGALVNTLAIAYVGASLPLLLLFYVGTPTAHPPLMNQEIFAAEIIRILIGSIGLVLAVPITTALAGMLLAKKAHSGTTAEHIKEEREALKHFHHHH